MTHVTHVAMRDKKGAPALFQYPAQIEPGSRPLDELRRDLTLQITKETHQRPAVVLIGIQGGKQQ